MDFYNPSIQNLSINPSKKNKDRRTEDTDHISKAWPGR